MDMCRVIFEVVVELFFYCVCFVFRDVSDFCKVGFFSEVGKRILVFVCFFIVIGELGYVDMVRDFCGFLFKFYMEEGNWDMVGNNILVFFVCDVVKFLDFIYF